MWQITLDASNEAAYPVLARDRVWNSFALADLAPPFRAFTRVALAAEEEAGLSAACLVVRHPALTVLSPFGVPDGVTALLERLDLPAETLIQTQAVHQPLLEQYYRFQSDGQALLRMAVSATTFRPPASVADRSIERLSPDDLQALQALYAPGSAQHFRPDLLEHGLFYSIGEGRRLLAAGGTHVLAREYGIAVLGNIFTHPEARRQGYARAITAALVSELLGQGCRDVVLNVVADNTPAIDLYAALGFRTHCTLWSAQANRK